MMYLSRYMALGMLALAAAVFSASSAMACGDCAQCKAAMAATETTPKLTTPTHTHGSPNLGAGGSESFRFAVLGDTQGQQFISKLITDMNAHNPALVVFPGDLVGTGGAGSWGQWKNNTAHFIGGPERRLMVPGNHDLPVGGDALWQQTFDWLPDSQTVGGVKGIDQMDYYYDHGNTRFVSVTTDSQANGAGGQPAALGWLDNVLNDPSTQSKEHVFVYSHHPITFNNYDNTGGTAGAWWQTMSQSGVVDGVFVGHWHQYQPSQPDPHSHSWELIAGTGNAGFSGHAWQNEIGYTMVEVNGAQAVASFYGDADNDGDYDDVLDSFIISGGAPEPTGVVAYYGFHDSSQNIDAAPAPLGKQNTGAYVGNAFTTPNSVNGPALVLDGDGDYAHGGGIGDYNLAILGDLTISLQANYDTLDTGDSANTLVSYTADVAGYTDREEAVNQPYNLRVRDDRHLELMWEHDNNEKEWFVSSIPADVTAGNWHEYRVTRDATTGEVVFYVDGDQLGQTLLFDPLTELPTGGGQGYLRFGVNYNRDNPAKLVGGFDGMIDEVVIWNEVTTAAFDPPNLPCNIVGDINGDCLVDVADWQVLRGNQHTNMTGMTLSQTAALGDLNGDFRNDHTDFVLFKQAYEAIQGQGAFARLLQVPEPATFGMIAGAAFALVVGRGRRRRSKHR